MPPQLPKSLIAALSALSVVSFGTSMYLEQFRLGFLQSHPISVNLLSGVVGFSTAALMAGVVFNVWTRNHKESVLGTANRGVVAAIRDLRGLRDELSTFKPANVEIDLDGMWKVAGWRGSLRNDLQRAVWALNGLLQTDMATTSLVSAYQQLSHRKETIYDFRLASSPRVAAQELSKEIDELLNLLARINSELATKAMGDPRPRHPA
jgi:hypothetical protein